MKNFAPFFISMLMLSGITKVCSQEATPADKFENIFTRTVHSKILNEERKIFVHLPENSNIKKYPVIYLLDGEVTERFGEALEGCKTNPHIIIGIETVENRNRDMIPVKISSRQSGGADKFLQFLIEELQPFVNGSYNGNGKNILYGGSNAGLFTIYAMLAKPDAFFAYISSSATIGHCNKFMIEKAKELSPKSRLNDKFLYIHYGLKDQYDNVTQFLPAYCELLNKEFKDNLSLEIVALQKGGHIPHGGIIGGLKYIYNNSADAG